MTDDIFSSKGYIIDTLYPDPEHNPQDLQWLDAIVRAEEQSTDVCPGGIWIRRYTLKA